MFSKTSRMFISAGVLWAPVTVTLAMGDRPVGDDEAANLRIQPVARVVYAQQPAAAGGAARSGEEMYKSFCTACHQTGAAGAPKTGDKAAWAPRIALGLDGLTKSAIAGKNAMPPKGTAANASEVEIAEAIKFMTNQSGANFK